MKKLFNDDLSIDELKKMLSNFKEKESKKKDKTAIIVLALAGIVIALAVFALIKYLNSEDDFDYFDDFDEDDDEYDEYRDENGCVYTDDEDFE